jgi:chemotaxis protein methyltransferase CheR
MGKEPSLVQQVVEALLNNETYFFRDRSPFDLLAATRCRARQRARRAPAAHLVGRLLDRAGSLFLAMLFAEDPAKWRGWTIDILGTDVLDSAHRSRAQRHLHPVRGAARPRHQQMIRWFEECDGGWRAVEALRKPSASRSTICSSRRRTPARSTSSCAATCCSTSAREKRTLAFERLASAMAPDGWLMLGAGETVIGQTKQAGRRPQRARLYRLTGDGSLIEKRAAGTAGPPRGLDRAAKLVRHARRWTSSTAHRPTSTSGPLPVSMIVLHYTGMPDCEGALDRLTRPKPRSRPLLRRRGRHDLPLVDEEKRAWHAGKSRWRGVTDVNSAPASGSRSSIPATSSAIARSRRADRGADPAGRRHQGPARHRPRQCRGPGGRVGLAPRGKSGLHGTTVPGNARRVVRKGRGTVPQKADRRSSGR